MISKVNANKSENHNPSLPKLLCKHEGKEDFKFRYDNIGNTPDKEAIFEIITGQILFFVEKNSEKISFYFFMPGSGSQVATVDISTLQKSGIWTISLSWSPEQIILSVTDSNMKSVSQIGELSTRWFYVNPKDGNIKQTTKSPETKTAYAQIATSTNTVILESAIDSWNQTFESIKELLTAQFVSQIDYPYQVMMMNLSISMLITAFESYCKRRFLEIENEGITPHLWNLVKEFIKPANTRPAIHKEIEDNLKNGIRNISEDLIDERDCINFQNFNYCKSAYNKGYQIIFGSIFTCDQMDHIKEVLEHRHKVIHSSPAVISLKINPRQPPVTIPNITYTNESLNIFEDCIKRLHQKTLDLR